MRHVLALALAIAAATPSLAAGPGYHLQVEATPQVAFPYLGKFGAIDLDVFPAGVRGEALWLHGFSRNGASSVTVANPLARMYVDVATADIAPTLKKLAAGHGGPERTARPKLGPSMKGTVKGVAATRYRLLYGEGAWVDVWTTTVIPVNPQYRLLVASVLNGIAPGSAPVVAQLPGTPVYVELNFRRFKKVPVVRLVRLTLSSEGQEDALTLGRLYVRAPLLEKILGVR